MEIIFFDLDGTLLNKSSQLSSFTKQTLQLLNERGIANTVATGRTMLAAKHVLGGYMFDFTQIYSNGVTVWDPQDKRLILDNVLEEQEINTILSHAAEYKLTPFVNTVDMLHPEHQHTLFYGEPQSRVESQLLAHYKKIPEAKLQILSDFTVGKSVTNISMVGPKSIVTQMSNFVNAQPSLVAYSGPSTEASNCYWMDIHHKMANKGSAIKKLRKQLGATRVICFGDSENDLSMFQNADECYAPENATEEIKNLSNQVIGHHDDDGIAKFLREKFSL